MNELKVGERVRNASDPNGKVGAILEIWGDYVFIADYGWAWYKSVEVVQHSCPHCGGEF